MTVLIIALIITGIICAFIVLPTQTWEAMGNWCLAFARRSKQRKMERELARLARQMPFQQDKSFLPLGIGLAFDTARRLVFVCVSEGGKLRAAILPVSAVKGYTTGEMQPYGFYDRYVELAETDATHKQWRILCGDNAPLVEKLRGALDEFGVLLN
jgi:hypothetical protein